MLLFLGILAGVINAVCFIPYFKDIVKGKTKPNRAAWLIWAVLSFVAFFSLLAKGPNPSLWLVGIQTLGIVAVAIMSLKYGSGSFTKKDYLSLCFAASGLVIWYFTKEPAAALFIAIIINAIGSVLNTQKVYKDPESETRITWVLGTVAAFMSVLSVGSLDFILLSYPVYTFLSNLVIVMVILLSQRQYQNTEYINVAYEYDTVSNEEWDTNASVEKKY